MCLVGARGARKLFRLRNKWPFHAKINTCPRRVDFAVGFFTDLPDGQVEILENKKVLQQETTRGIHSQGGPEKWYHHIA